MLLKQSLRGALLLAMVSAASAQTPLDTTFTYQGRLRNAGAPANGLYDLRFHLFGAAAGGAQVGPTICFNNVTVADGLFTIALDFGAQFAGQQRFLEIEVRADTGQDCSSAIGFVTLTPRQPLTAAPNALFTLNADRLDGLDSTAFLQAVPTPLTLTGTSINHIIRGTNDSASFISSGIFGSSTAASGTTSGVRGVSSSTSGRGVYGLAEAATGSTYGVYGESDSTSGRGVYGLATADSGTTYGGRFESASTSGTGVYGIATADDGPAYGVYGQSSSPAGSGVYALSTPNSGGFGVYAKTTSPSGDALFAWATAAAGSTRGVYGISSSASGTGVYGWGSAPNGNSYGVVGRVNASNSGYGVYSYGDLGSSGVKSFRIDHPFDPENKYLLHYATESPEVLNFYSGKVVLDKNGEAVVELPAYFAGINKDPRYTLTPIGAPMPMLHVAEEISEEALQAGEQAGPGVAPPICFFRIAGGKPGAKVSWRVEALRNDLRMRTRAAPVEPEKQDVERGKYQQPEFYGQPPEKGMAFDAAHAPPAVAPEATPH